MADYNYNIARLFLSLSFVSIFEISILVFAYYFDYFPFFISIIFSTF